MPTILLGNDGSSDTAYANGGALAIRDTSAYSEEIAIDKPFDMWAIDERVSTANFEGRTYGVGGFGGNWLIDEHMRMLRQGIRPPSSPPTVGVGGGANNFLCYLRFYDEVTGERSPFSGVTSVTGAVPRTWTVLPTEEPGYTIEVGGTTTVNGSTTVNGTNTAFFRLRVGDRIAVSSAPTVFVTVTSIPSNGQLTVDTAIGDGTAQTIIVRASQRATHIELWVGEQGLDPRLRARRQLGVATVVESVSLLDAGESSDDAFEAMPRGTINAIYHGRQLIAGVPGEEDTLFISEMLYPERWGGLTEVTKDGDAITGLAVERDYCLVTTPRSSYVLQGYTEDDIRFDVSEPELGCANHWGMVNIHGYIWIPNDKGVYIYNGAWHLVTQDRSSEWREEYKKYRTEFERGYGVHDAENKCYKYVWTIAEGGRLEGEPPEPYSWIWMIGHRTSWLPLNAQPGTYEWVAEYTDCLPQAGGGLGQPAWTNFYRRAVLKSQCNIKIPRSSTGTLLMGKGDGTVTKQSRVDDGILDNEWDWDSWAKRALLLTPHYTMGAPGGNPQEGKTLLRVWSYVEAEQGSGDPGWYWIFVPIAGDDAAGWIGSGWDTLFWYDKIGETHLDISRPAPFSDTVHYSPVTVHPHPIPENISGRGFSFLYEAWSCPEWSFSGVGGYWDAGPAGRPPRYIEPPGG